MRIPRAVFLGLLLPVYPALAAYDPEDITKLLQEADRALAEPKPAPKAPVAPPQASVEPAGTPAVQTTPDFKETGDSASETKTLPEPVAAEPEPTPAADETPVSVPKTVTPKAAAVPKATTYKVWIWQETGDTLWRIAEKVYGDRDKWRLIYLANKDVIKDPNRIYPKQRLRIPPADWQPE